MLDPRIGARRPEPLAENHSARAFSIQASSFARAVEDLVVEAVLGVLSPGEPLGRNFPPDAKDPFFPRRLAWARLLYCSQRSESGSPSLYGFGLLSRPVIAFSFGK